MFETDRDDPYARSGFTYRDEPRAPSPETAAVPYRRGSDPRSGEVMPDEAGDKADHDEAMFRRLMGHYQHELGVQYETRRLMSSDEAMYDGEQWEPDDAAVLQERGQIPLVYNVIAPAVNWLLGTERRTRAQYKVLARRKDGTKAAERKSQLLKFTDDLSHADMYKTLAFADAVKAGIGWLETGWQDDDLGPRVFSGRESWRNMVWDSRSQKPDMSDARYLFRARWMDEDTVLDLFPHKRALIETSSVVDVLGLGAMAETGDEFMDAIEEMQVDQAERSLHRHARRRNRVIEAWYRRLAPVEMIRGGQFSGQLYDPRSEGHYRDLIRGEAAIVMRQRMRMHVAIFCGAGMLYNEPSPYRHNQFPFTPIIGNRRGKDGTFYGIIRNMADMQRDVNKRASKALYILSSEKIIMDEGAVEDEDELLEEAAKPNGLIRKKQGKELTIGVERDLAAAHIELFSRGVDMIQQLSGITDEAMGRTTNAVSGKAITARQTQGTVATAHYLDNLRFALRIHGEKQLSNIEQFYTEEFRFRITNTRGTPDYVTANDPEDSESSIVHTKADFIISEDDWKATVRQAQVDELLNVVGQLAPVSPQLVFALLDLLVEAMDIPSKDEIVARIRQITGMEDPDADPNAQDPETLARKAAKDEQARMEKRAANAEISDKEATAAEKQARAFNARLQGLKEAQNIGADHLNIVRQALDLAVEGMSSRPAGSAADAFIRQAIEQAATAFDIATQPTPQQQLPAPDAMPAQAQPGDLAAA